MGLHNSFNFEIYQRLFSLKIYNRNMFMKGEIPSNTEAGRK